MKHILITTIAAAVLGTTAFAGPIHDAAKKGNFRAVMQHLAAGTDVNAKDNLGSTPLHSAAMGGHKKIVEVLISNGADVNSTDEDGRTPLDFAGGETAELLRKHGAKTGKELAMMPRLEYGEDQWPFGFSFTAKKGRTYVVEVTQDFKQWGELETIKGRGKQVEFIDPRQPLVQFKRNFYRVKVVE